jgi:uncharacterized protein YcfL
MKKYMILVLVALGFMGCAKSTDMEIEGKLSVKGSEPHSYLSIKDTQSKTSYKIQNRESFDLTTKQKQTVKIRAKLVKEAVGPGFPAVIEVVEVK